MPSPSAIGTRSVSQVAQSKGVTNHMHFLTLCHSLTFALIYLVRDTVFVNWLLLTTMGHLVGADLITRENLTA
jgi:hypothetical protein